MKRTIEQFGARRLATILAGGLAVMFLIGLLLSRGSEPQMGYLYTDLDPGSISSISEKLRGQNIAFKISPDGTAVMAPADRLAELRMTFAADQLGGKIGYDVIDQEQPFGTSASRAKLNERRAVEGELARSIETMQSVRKARVHIVMPEHELFSDNDRPASAAITLTTLGRLSHAQTDAIRYLVAASVPDLSPDRISIVDQSGTLLARLGDGEAGVSSLAERQTAIEGRLRENVEQLLERIVGPGKARAEVVAELDPAQVREESQIYDPDRQVIAKQTSVDSNNEADERSRSGDASVSAQLPGADVATDGDSRRTMGKETSEEVVYDNSVVKKTAINPGGEVKRLTVSVMVDRAALRSNADTERLTRIVENAVGYDEERGDRVVVEAMPFAPAADEPEEEGAAFMTGSQIVSLSTNIILGLLALAAVVMVVRTLRSGSAVLPADLPTSTPLPPPMLPPEIRELAARAAEGDQEAVREIAALENASRAPALDQEIDLAFVNGRMKATTMARVGDVVKENKTESVAVVRQWMQE